MMDTGTVVSAIAITISVIVIIVARKVEAEGRTAWAIKWHDDSLAIDAMMKRVGPFEKRRLRKAILKAREESR